MSYNQNLICAACRSWSYEGHHPEAWAALARHWADDCRGMGPLNEALAGSLAGKEVGRALVTIEAMKLTRANAFEIMAWLRDCDIFSTVALAGVSTPGFPPTEIRLHIQGRDRTPRTVAAEGDYVLKTMRGEFDSASPENFEAALAKWSEAK